MFKFFPQNEITTRIIYNKGLDCAELQDSSKMKCHLELTDGETYLTAKSYPLL
jgi:hypothetical protein